MGLPLACTLGRHGGIVTVCDVNRHLVGQIQDGICPYEEPGLAQLMSQLRSDRRLMATTDTAAAVGESNAVVVIVPAHLTPERKIDYAILESASADVGRGLKPGTLVVYETTVSMGGTRRVL